MTSAVQYRDVVTPSNHTTIRTTPNSSGDRMTLTEFASRYADEFPTKFVVCKGFYGPNNDLKISDGDRFKAHSLSQMPVVNIEYDNGRRDNIPADSAIHFAILYNPQNNHSEAIAGYKYEKVSDLVQLPVLPPILWSRKAYRGSSPESSISANEILIVRRVKSRLVGKQQLKVYSLTQKKEKTLYTSCVGNFSTKPRDVSIFLSDILKYMPDIFPCRAVMFNAETVHTPGNSVPVPMRTGSCLVTMMHSSINTLLRVSSSLGKGFETSQMKYLDVPIDLGIMVRRDNSSEDDNHLNVDDLYEDASMYKRFDHQQPLPPNSSLDPEPVSNQCTRLYTNVHFGQEVMRRADQGQNACTSVPQAFESGHYQTPTSLKVRTSSDPIAIGSTQRPSNDTLPGNYVLLSSADRGGSAGSGGSSGSAGLGEAKGPGSLERNSPRNSNGSGSSPSSSYRPPLPPPNRVRKSQQLQQQRTPGYDYVDTNPIRSARVFNEMQQHRPTENGGNGAVQSDAHPDSVVSGGSGGAVVERNFSDGHVGRPYPHPGSGDGIVERSMRTSSSNSTASNYSKANPPASPNHTHNPASSKSSGYYSHLRSHSGPPVTPQLPSLSAQVMQKQLRMPTVIATTRLDSDSESLVVVQRQVSTPACARGRGCQPSGPAMSRCESSPVGFTAKDRPDSLSVVLDDLAKMTQELEETAFQQDSNEDISPSETRRLQASQESLTTTCNPPPSQGTISTKDLSPEVIEKHRAYLISMDIYQVLSLLEMMGLEQYTPTFKQEQINGDILSTCDDALLRDELKVTSRLHRMRLLRVIEGTYSVHEIMSGKDGYIFMSSAGKQ